MKGNSDALYEATSTAILLAGGSFLSVLVAGLGSLALARILGPEGYGAYSLVLAVPAFLLSFVDLGMSAAMVRYPSRYPERAASYVASGFLAVALAASTATALGALGSEYFSRVLINRPEYSGLVLISMPYLLAYSLLNTIRASLVGIGRRVGAASLEPLYNMLKASLSISLAMVMYTRGAILGVVAASAASSLVGLTMLQSSLTKVEFRPRLRDLRELLRFSAPLYATSLISSLTQVYTTLALSRLFTDFEIGNYRAALNLSTVVSIAIAPFSTAFLRVFSELGAQDFKELFADSVKYVALFSVPLTLFSSAVSYDIVRVVYGRRYTEVDTYFSIVVLTNALTLLGSHVVGSALSAMNKTRCILLSNIIGSAIYVPLLHVLVGGYGLLGAAVSFLALSAVVVSAQLCFLKRSAGVSLDPRFSLKVLFSALVPSLALLPTGRGHEFADSLLLLVAKFAVFLAAYVALLAASRAIGESEIRVLARLSESLGPLSRAVEVVLRCAALLVRLLQRGGDN